MVFQNYALYPHMTVYDNMAFGLKLRKYDKEDIDKRVHHAARFWGWRNISNANRLLFPVVSVNVSPWVAQSCVTRRFS